MPFDVSHDGADGNVGEDFRTVDVEASADFQDAVFEQVPVAFIQSFPQFQGLSVHDAAVHDFHEVDVSGGGVAHNGVHLHIVDAGIHHGALGLEFQQGLLSAPEFLCLFECEFTGGLLHGPIVCLHEVLDVALQDIAYGLHTGVIVFL